MVRIRQLAFVFGLPRNRLVPSSVGAFESSESFLLPPDVVTKLSYSQASYSQHPALRVNNDDLAYDLAYHYSHSPFCRVSHWTLHEEDPVGSCLSNHSWLQTSILSIQAPVVLQHRVLSSGCYRPGVSFSFSFRILRKAFSYIETFLLPCAPCIEIDVTSAINIFQHVQNQIKKIFCLRH